mmetsp:Transcript_31846/g.36364  ORF Transcript_31846/g.36364 Transcript_31846/m.36364 type:complete len:225 (-) Transcript_31846:218-892(-)
MREHLQVKPWQVKRIFKFVQRTLKSTQPNKTIDSDVEIQRVAIREITNILLGKDDDEPKTHEVKDESHKDPKEDYYYYQNTHESYLQFYNQFRLDIEQFLKEVQTKKMKMKESRQTVISKVEELISTIPHIEYSEIYGSYQTNLDLPWSDIDFVIFSESFSSTECLRDLYQNLEAEKQKGVEWINKIDYYSTAYVPIIKMQTEINSFEVKVDITFKDETHRGSD